MKCIKCGKEAKWVESPPPCPTCDHQDEGSWELTCDCPGPEEVLVAEMSKRVVEYETRFGTLTILKEGELNES